jgi:hemerythrin-like domain-containing protein
VSSVLYARYRVGTFYKCLADCIKTLRDFCDGLEYQIQFEDQRILRLANNYLSREKCSQLDKIFVANDERTTTNAIFNRTQPQSSDIDIDIDT